MAQLARVKQSYTEEARRLAGRSITQLEQTSVTPDALTISGVGLCIGGSVVDILDGALARRRSFASPFGAFLDSTVDRVGEGFMLGAIGLVLMRRGSEWGVALAFAAMAGSFLVSYTRARAEALGLKGDVGIGSRAERVVVITAGLVLAPWGLLPWAIYVLTATAWFTVAQRVLSVRTQLRARG